MIDKYVLADIMLGFIGEFYAARNQIPVIYYHSVVKGAGSTYMYVNYDNFCRHMEWIMANGYKTVLFDKLNDNMQKTKNEKLIVIAFDDGWRDNFSLIFPFMKSHGLKYNIFLQVGSIDTDKYLTWDMVKKMHKSKLVSFGAHTWSHIDARKIDDSNYEKEILMANSKLESELGYKINDFCFPFGFYDKRIISFLDKKKTYKRLYTSDWRKHKKMDNSIIVGRCGIRNEDNLSMLSNKISGKYSILYDFQNMFK